MTCRRNARRPPTPASCQALHSGANDERNRSSDEHRRRDRRDAYQVRKRQGWACRYRKRPPAAILPVHAPLRTGHGANRSQAEFDQLQARRSAAYLCLEPGSGGTRGARRRTRTKATASDRARKQNRYPKGLMALKPGEFATCCCAARLAGDAGRDLFPGTVAESAPENVTATSPHLPKMPPWPRSQRPHQSAIRKTRLRWRAPDLLP